MFELEVLAGLALVAVGVGVYRPDLFGAALPILLLAACPLSMLWMMRSMNQGEGVGGRSQNSNSSDDPAILRAQMNMLAAEQEKVSERLARLSASQRPVEDDLRPTSTPPDTA